MKTFSSLCLALGVILLTNLNAFGQQSEYSVALHVVHNGSPIHLPAKVVVKNDKRLVTLPVQAGHILVPTGLARGSSLTLQARIGKDLIKIPGIPVSALSSSWTIVMADENFGEDYANALPKGTDVRAACIIVLDPKDGDGTVLGVSNCRKPVDH